MQRRKEQQKQELQLHKLGRFPLSSAKQMQFLPSKWRVDVDENALSNLIIGAAIEVHRTLGGPGLLESLYEESLDYELQGRGLQVNRQVDVPVYYKGRKLKEPLRLDMIVNDLVIIECKNVVNYHPIYEAQALTYLRLTRKKLALVINFGEAAIKNGVHRVVNGI